MTGRRWSSGTGSFLSLFASLRLRMLHSAKSAKISRGSQPAFPFRPPPAPNFRLREFRRRGRCEGVGDRRPLRSLVPSPEKKGNVCGRH